MPNVIQRSFKSEYSDWVVTSLFYSALHLITKYCNKRSISFSNHTARRNFVKNSALEPIHDDYHMLHLLSNAARYKRLYLNITESDVRNAQNWLDKIENHISSLERN